MGKYQARICADHILGRPAAATADLAGSPRVVFTEPQVAAVGLTLAAAEERDLPVEAVDVQTSANAGASFVGRNAPGTSRLVIDEERRSSSAPPSSAPRSPSRCTRRRSRSPARSRSSELVHAVPAFPTRSEVWLYLLEKYGC